MSFRRQTPEEKEARKAERTSRAEETREQWQAKKEARRQGENADSR
jgi:hypothetical protein